MGQPSRRPSGRHVVFLCGAHDADSVKHMEVDEKRLIPRPCESGLGSEVPGGAALSGGGTVVADVDRGDQAVLDGGSGWDHLGGGAGDAVQHAACGPDDRDAGVRAWRGGVAGGGAAERRDRAQGDECAGGGARGDSGQRAHGGDPSGSMGCGGGAVVPASIRDSWPRRM